MLARLYERISNKRHDFLHKTSTYYASRYDLIFLERLKTTNLTKNHRLARKILDAGWYTFRTMCKYKANRVVDVEPAYSSIECSFCSHPVPKSLAIRTHVCPRCGVIVDRDYNSALNHLQNGLVMLNLPVERRKVTPVEPQCEVVETGMLHGDMQITGKTGLRLSGKPSAFQAW